MRGQIHRCVRAYCTALFQRLCRCRLQGRTRPSSATSPPVETSARDAPCLTNSSTQRTCIGKAGQSSTWESTSCVSCGSRMASGNRLRRCRKMVELDEETSLMHWPVPSLPRRQMGRLVRGAAQKSEVAKSPAIRGSSARGRATFNYRT